MLVQPLFATCLRAQCRRKDCKSVTTHACVILRRARSLKEDPNRVLMNLTLRCKRDEGVTPAVGDEKLVFVEKVCRPHSGKNKVRGKRT